MNAVVIGSGFVELAAKIDRIHEQGVVQMFAPVVQDRQ